MSEVSGSFIDPGHWKKWAEGIREFDEAHGTADEPIAFIVIDTLARNFGHGNENETEAMSRFIEAVERLALEFGTAIVVVHHAGHSNKTRGRGSSSLGGAVVAGLLVTKDRVGVKVKLQFAKDMESGSVVHGRLAKVDLGVADHAGNPITPVVFDGVDSVFEDEELVEDELSGDDLSELRELLGVIAASPDGVTREAVQEALGMTKRTTLRRLKEATDACHVQATGGAQNRRYFLTRKGLDSCHDEVARAAEIKRLLSE